MSGLTKLSVKSYIIGFCEFIEVFIKLFVCNEPKISSFETKTNRLKTLDKIRRLNGFAKSQSIWHKTELV